MHQRLRVQMALEGKLIGRMAEDAILGLVEELERKNAGYMTKYATVRRNGGPR
jgi:hypothetical protein